MNRYSIRIIILLMAGVLTGCSISRLDRRAEDEMKTALEVK